MAAKFEALIRAYCAQHGVIIPPGFGRNTPSRYAIIYLGEPPKLVAHTWFKVADVVYYLQHNVEPKDNNQSVVRILDFKDQIELTYSGGAQLKTGGQFNVVAA